ncbi:MAG: hypothetical protein PHV74_16150 [Dehalococcoidia bacterium]|nr:hypothetical protein [Dehalococcoidia bacterium]
MIKEKTAITVMASAPWFTEGTNSGVSSWYPHVWESHGYISTYVGGMGTGPSAPDGWAKFQPYLSQPGSYDIYVGFFACVDTSRRVPVTIGYADGEEVVLVDQFSETNQWIEQYLGRWNFDVGPDSYVEITDATGEFYDGTKGLTIGCVNFVRLGEFSTTVEKFSLVEAYDTFDHGLNVRSPNPCSDIVEEMADGSIGVIIEGPAYWDGQHRYRIRWENGVEGWSALSYLRERDFAPSTRFDIGDDVAVQNTGALGLQVRESPPNLASTGYHVFDGEKGTIVGGPFYGVPKGTGGLYHFWQVDFDGKRGWCAQGDTEDDYLAKIGDTD